MSIENQGLPLAGLRVVEVSLGTSAIGTGLAASLPGALLRDFGAEVVRVQFAERSTLDAGVEFARVWDRGKELLEITDPDGPEAAATIADLAAEADVMFTSGGQQFIENRGLGYADLARLNPRLIGVRIRPSYDAKGPVPDLELLVQARAGHLSHVNGHRPGPIFGDLTVGSAGAGLAAAAGTLALLYERETTGRGGWAETSLYDGMLALLAMTIGRVEYPSPATEMSWGKATRVAPGLSYRCADGEYVQLWFGAKGAYEAFLDHVGDPPSEAGYQADMSGGAIAERSVRWEKKFATRDRSWWLEYLAGHDFRCEPILRPGEALRDEHARRIGLSIDCETLDRGPITMLGPVATVAPFLGSGGSDFRGTQEPSRLLSGVHVVDMAAYLAGPVTAQVLADLGADVVKVEPVTGDVHRSVEALFSAGQRGKRAMAVNLKAPDAHRVLEQLFRWGDVVHHNSRVGLSDRLGYDEDTVRAANPNVVYSFASGFGSTGPRALLPANDHLMQALSGVESAQGGEEQPPRFLGWGAIDITSGWVAACGVIVGLYARRRSERGQSVNASLFGAGLLLKSGAFLAGDVIVSGPVVDHDQTGYGATYRIYEGRDGAWLALAIPDTPAWIRFRQVVQLEALPDTPPPLRTPGEGKQPAEKLLEELFATREARAWVSQLRAANVPAELVFGGNWGEAVARILDDPVGRQLGRVVSYKWGPRGRLDQPAFPVRFGPALPPSTRRSMPGLGEHTIEVLQELGFGANERSELEATGTILIDER